MVEIIEAGELERYEFYCFICGTRFRARVDEYDRVLKEDDTERAKEEEE